MSDVNISKYRAQVIRQGSTPASPGFVVSEGQNPVDPSGSGQTHLPVTIASATTGLSITESQILSGAGLVSQYIRGDGSLADFPATTGGGSSVSYYLNGSVSQGTIGGVAYKQLNRTPVFGAGTDISINANGYIASFITDASDPNKLLIPAGNWNFETYFSASSNGGTPSFYVELYKYDGTTFTLIATSSSAPELIAFGTNLNPYFSTLAVPQTTLALTDRLALRYYVTHSGRTITLHTENNHLCQIITTFTTGLTALNGLTAQVQNFAVGTSGTDFAISSATATHTFNLPTASATNRGALSSADWTTFNGKENAITAGTTAQYFRGDKTFQTLNTAAVLELTNLYYTEARVNANTNVAANTAARHNAVTLGTANGLSLSTQVLSLGLASAGVTGALSGTDWTTFNGKQNALTNPVTGTGTSGTLPKFTGASTIGNSLFTDNGTNGGFGGANYSSGTGVRSFNISAQDYPGLSFWANNQQTASIYGLGFTGSLNLDADPANLFTSTKISFAIDGTERFAVFSNGNVAIANSPTDNGAKFQVSGTATISSTLTAAGVISSSTVRPSSNFAADLGTSSIRWAEIFGYAINLTNNAVISGTLGVTSTATFSSTVTLNGTNSQLLQTISNSIAGDNAAVFYNSNANSFGVYIGAGSGTNHALYITDSTRTKDLFKVSGNGNVGIGTTPAVKFQINDGTNINLGIKVGQTDTSAVMLNAFNDAVTANIPLEFRASRFGFQNGNVLINTTTDAGFKLDVAGTGRFTGTITSEIIGPQNLILKSSSQFGGYVQFERSGTTFGYLGNAGSVTGSNTDDMALRSQNGLRFLTGGNNLRMTIDSSGNIGAPSGTNIYNASDLRLKRNISKISSGLDKITSLNPVKFNWLDGFVPSENGKEMLGFIAQEVFKIIPEAVESFGNNSITINNIEIKNPLRVNEKFIIPVLVKAMQEQQEQINELKNKLL